MNDLDWDILSSYIGLLALASGSVYVGAFGSLPVGSIQESLHRRAQQD